MDDTFGRNANGFSFLLLRPFHWEQKSPFRLQEFKNHLIVRHYTHGPCLFLAFFYYFNAGSFCSGLFYRNWVALYNVYCTALFVLFIHHSCGHKLYEHDIYSQLKLKVLKLKPKQAPPLVGMIEQQLHSELKITETFKIPNFK